MNAKTISYFGLLLIAISHLLLAFGYDFLMSQRPIDFAHWAMLLGAIFLFSLWFSLPESITKKFGLGMMSLGIAGIAGMCMIDFLLWSMGDDGQSKETLFNYVSNTPSIQVPFMVLGPALFYAGICVATYGLFKAYKWQVALLNVGGMMIGLGHMLFHNGWVAAIGGFLFLIGMGALLNRSVDSE